MVAIGVVAKPAELTEGSAPILPGRGIQVDRRGFDAAEWVTNLGGNDDLCSFYEKRLQDNRCDRDRDEEHHRQSCRENEPEEGLVLQRVSLSCGRQRKGAGQHDIGAAPPGISGTNRY